MASGSQHGHPQDGVVPPASQEGHRQHESGPPEKQEDRPEKQQTELEPEVGHQGQTGASRHPRAPMPSDGHFVPPGVTQPEVKDVDKQLEELDKRIQGEKERISVVEDLRKRLEESEKREREERKRAEEMRERAIRAEGRIEGFEAAVRLLESMRRSSG